MSVVEPTFYHHSVLGYFRTLAVSLVSDFSLSFSPDTLACVLVVDGATLHL